jgi:diguanylate cyclase (GGDEF)-like protein
MESASTPPGVPSSLDPRALSAAAREAAAVAGGEAEPHEALDAAVGALHEAVPGLLPSVFVLEHGRLWLVAQRGYAVVPDGIRVESGVMGRAVRLGRAELTRSARTDPDYLAALPGVSSELAVPLLAAGVIVGILNVESEHALPRDAAGLVEPLAAALAPLAETLRTGRALDLPALARLFVHIGSIRDPEEIAAIAAASLAKVLPLEASQVLLWDESGTPVELASWRADGAAPPPLSGDDLARARDLVEPTVVCRLLELEAGGGPPLVLLPLRANGEEIGALVGARAPAAGIDPVQLDTAAVLAAHIAACLDAAVVLRRERQSAVTDPLTGVLNRRGLEERLERELASSHERRVPMSVLVIDCDDLKEINDRAGHEFGDALLREVAAVLTRSVPDGAGAARLGGDEFVVTLPEAGPDIAEALGERIRTILADGLTEAGFPLRISAGISTYPFDGAGATALLRAADQALYAAKDAGKDRIASFHEVARPGRRTERTGSAAGERRRRPPGDASVLRDAAAAVEAIEAETTGGGVCNRLCKSLVFVVGATACSASWVDGDYLVDVTGHALRDVSLGRDVAYRISDFPLTAEVLRSGHPHAVSFADGDVDSAEAFVLRELKMNALLMLPLRVRGALWGLVELYEMRLRRFTEDDIAVAQFLVGQAERRLDVVAASNPPSDRPPVYELSPDDEAPRGPRTR